MRSFNAFAFRLGAIAMVFAAAAHCAALISPTFAKAFYSVSYPVWRHALFVTINMSFAGLLLWRPRWLVWPYALLVVQQLNGHGGRAWMVWSREGRIAWIDVVVVVCVLLIFWLLISDWRDRRARTA